MDRRTFGRNLVAVVGLAATGDGLLAALSHADTVGVTATKTGTDLALSQAPQAKTPALMAHRGASSLAPENTLAAFRKALETKSQWVELDVHLTADGEVVVMHDGTVDRTTDGTGPIAKMTLAQIKALDAGSWFKPEFVGERVPTLAEVVALLGKRLRINVEIKSSGNAATAQKVVEILRKGGVLEQSMISSFGLQAVLEVRKYSTVPLLALISGKATDLQTTIDKGLPYFNIEYRQVDAALVEKARAAGVRLCVWTVDNPALWPRFVDLGADIVCTNRPHLMPV
ncbi:MAG: glycerophosphodiester phosphodiesterase family protein [Armatimonadia bacterium]